MTPGPSLQELIQTVRTDAASDDALEQLAAASRTAAELEETVDAVLAHFVDQCRRAGRSWSEISGALGVTKQAAHKRFSLPAVTLERLGAPTFERFTERARAALSAATHAAAQLQHGYVGTEHLLLGLFEPAGGVAARVLAELGITHEQVQARVLETVPRGTVTSGERPFTPRAQGALTEALTVALGLGHNYIGTEHLLLGLYGDANGLAATILPELGAHPDDVRNRVINKLAGFTTPRA